MSEEEFNNHINFITQKKHFLMAEGFSSKDETFEYEIYVWVAGDDNDVEGKFLNWYTNEPLLYLPWGEPPYKGSTSYNWMRTYILAFQNETNTMIKESDLYNARAVHDSVPLCTIDSRVLNIKLRGLCKDLSFDREYFYTINELGKQVFQGRTSSVIQYNSTSSLWLLSDIKDNTSLITSASPRESFLLGLHQVSFKQAKEDKCFQDKIFQPIKFTSCKEGFFTCNDGVCIPMSKRCDQTAHCEDKSDEKNCKLVIIEENYNKNIAPFTVDPDNEQIEAVKVNVSSEIIDILNINEVEQAFEVKFRLFLSWYDVRLIFHNLKMSRMANSPAIDEVERLWIPNIIFDNTKNNDVITFDPLAKVTISREGALILSEETVVDEINVFNGFENKIIYDRIFTKTIKCIYQLQLYPFDTQECMVNLEVGKYERKIMMILPQSIEMKGETMLSQYFITGWKLEFKNTSEKKHLNHFDEFYSFQKMNLRVCTLKLYSREGSTMLPLQYIFQLYSSSLLSMLQTSSKISFLRP